MGGRREEERERGKRERWWEATLGKKCDIKPE